jgi:hypothetical protein
MYKMIAVVMLLVNVHIQADEVELIYKPKVLSPEIDNVLDVEEYKWQLGLLAGQSLVENQDHSLSYGISVNYLIWQQWYATARLSQKELQLEPGAKESAIAWSLGAGYSVLEGAAYITDGLTLPWQMYTEAMVGEQSLEGKAASYVEGAIGWQLNKDNNYAAIEWRYFSIDDKRLQQIDSDKGYQWSLEFGRYF